MKTSNNLLKYKHFLVLCLFMVGMYFNTQSVNASTTTMSACELNQSGHSCLPVYGTTYLLCHADGGAFCGNKPPEVEPEEGIDP